VNDVVADLNHLRLDPAFRDARVLLAGDFNTCLDGSTWYGDPEARAILVSGLARAGLKCHTLEDIRATLGADRAIVDHLWTSTNLCAAESLHIWCDRDEPGRLSDHNGVSLRLAATP
jgi:endonuclease/exonuclease/phosphatase family metal-dependent hydrolase